MKRIHANFYSLITIILIVSIIIFSVLSSNLNDSPRKYKIAVLLDNSQSSGWDIFKAGLSKAAEDYGMEVQVLPTDDMLSSQTMADIAMEQTEAGADALVLQVCDDEKGIETVNLLATATPIAVIDGDRDMISQKRSGCAFVGFDNSQLGESLAEEALKLYDGDMSGKRVAIVSGDLDHKDQSDRIAALTNKLQDYGASIQWTFEYTNTSTDLEKQILQRLYKNPVEMVIALDNDCLEAVVKCKLQVDDDNDYMKILGVGNSNKVLYYLDTGVINTLVVPDYFEMGYQCIRELAERLSSRTSKMEDFINQYRVIYRETMFDEDEQQYLYIIQ